MVIIIISAATVGRPSRQLKGRNQLEAVASNVRREAGESPFVCLSCVVSQSKVSVKRFREGGLEATRLLVDSGGRQTKVALAAKQQFRFAWSRGRLST